MLDSLLPPLFTSCYSHGRLITASGLAPVRISVGHPRFKLSFELAGACKHLMPERAWLSLDQPRYEELFRQRLAAAGVETIARELEAIRQAHGGNGIVLLCFEKLQTPGEWCHRRMFAEFWREQTGESVPELSEQLPQTGLLF